MLTAARTCLVCFSKTLAGNMADVACTGAARRRRERRLRSWWRHERMSIAMALATVEHHSYGPTANDALRGQRTVTRAGEGEVREEHQALRGQTRLLPGTRPAPLVEVQPEGAMVQHSGIFELVQALDVPVLQMVDVHSFFRISVPAVAEQVIEVPKLAVSSCAVQRAALSEPQLVDQLVEVPTVLSFSLLQQRTAEQIVDTPVPHGRGGGARGGLQGLSQGQGSTAVSGADHVNTPVPHVSGGGARGGLQGLSQGQGSSAVCGAENVDIPVPHGRVGKRGLHGFPRGQSSTASAVEQTVGVDRGGPQRFPRGQSSTASAFEQTFSQAPHRSLPQAPVHSRHDEWVCVVDVENDNEYYWNRWDNSTCWRMPRGVKHRWCLLTSGLYRDVVSQGEPLSDHVQFCILAGMDQKDTYAVGFGGDDTFPVPFHRQSGGHSCFMCMDLADPVSCRKYSGAFVFTAPFRSPP